MGLADVAAPSGSDQCDARLRTKTMFHAVGDRCPKLGRFVLTAGGTTMLVCRHCARVVGMTLAERGVSYTLRELPRVHRKRKGRIEPG